MKFTYLLAVIGLVAAKQHSMMDHIAAMTKASHVEPKGIRMINMMAAASNKKSPVEKKSFVHHIAQLAIADHKAKSAAPKTSFTSILTKMAVQSAVKKDQSIKAAESLVKEAKGKGFTSLLTKIASQNAVAPAPKKGLKLISMLMRTEHAKPKHFLRTMNLAMRSEHAMTLKKKGKKVETPFISMMGKLAAHKKAEKSMINMINMQAASVSKKSKKISKKTKKQNFYKQHAKNF